MLDEATIQEHWNNCLLPQLISWCTIPNTGTNLCIQTCTYTEPVDVTKFIQRDRHQMKCLRNIFSEDIDESNNLVGDELGTLYFYQFQT